MAGPPAVPDRPPRTLPSGLIATAAVAPFLIFATVYLSAAGHGFIKDDYAWILQSRVRDAADLWTVLRTDNGFYRPVVSLTFTIDEWLFGVHPLGYGITNVALALLCGVSIASLARALGLSRGAAWLAAALWLLNLQGIRMAVLWTSGRTALLLTLAATAAATALVRGRFAMAVVWVIVALFSKEEAVLLPAILLGWLMVLARERTSGRRIGIGAWIIGAGVAEGLYFLARSSTAASTPWSAPWYYQPTFDLGVVLENIASYADRVATVPLAVTLLAAVVLGVARPLGGRDMRALLVCGAIWLVGGFGATIFLPVRSDLYACFPSVAVCLVAAAMCGRLWEASTDARRARSLVGALMLVGLMTPVYLARTERWSSLAEFGDATLSDLTRLAAPLPAGATVVIEDDLSTRVNLSTAFGTLLGDAYVLAAGRNLNFWVEPAMGGADLAGMKAPCDTCVDLKLKVSGGRLEPSERK